MKLYWQLAPCDVISKIKQNSSDMNEIILASCDAGYVQSCTGFFMFGPFWSILFGKFQNLTRHNSVIFQARKIYLYEKESSNY
jgi:hypothetical protein